MARGVLFLSMILCAAAWGGKIPSGGIPVSFENAFEQWRLVGKERQSASSSAVSVSGMPFKQCVEVRITNRTERGYDIMLSGGAILGQIEKDDVLLCSFYVRCLESSDESVLGKCTVTSRARHPARWFHPFTKTYTVGGKWKQFLIPFKAPTDNKDGYEVGFLLGGVKPQTLQIAGLQVINYQDKREISELPVTETRYDGMEPDASWRKAAHARIREHRMEDLKVQVADRNGKPVEGAKVRMELKNHAYGFGVAVGLNSMFNPLDPEDAQAYRDAVEDLFNKAVFENRMKWKIYQDDDAQLEKAVAWFAERNIPIRGHCMVWPAWQRLPRGMTDEYQSKTNEFRGVIEDHVRKMATAYPNTFVEWDIVNELYSQHEFVDMYGKEVVADWFRIAKESNPNFKTYINDYGILAGNDAAHQNNYCDWIKYLLEQGAPLEGIGLQGHFRAPVPPEEILRRLDRFAEFGLPMQITEFDFEETDELLQARFTRDFMTIVFSHPKTVGIMTWCLWEDSAWKPSAAFYSSDWKKRRIAQAWEHMIKTEWHTDKTVRTDESGTASIRAFLGDYQITVTRGSKTKTVFQSLEKGTEQITVAL